MSMITTGLNKIRDLHSGLITHIEVGTGTDNETEDDTDLQSPISGTEIVVDSSTTTSQQLIKQGTIPSTVGIGNNMTELGWKDTSPETMHSRITHTSISHTIAEDIVYSTRWYYKGG